MEASKPMIRRNNSICSLLFLLSESQLVVVYYRCVVTTEEERVGGLFGLRAPCQMIARFLSPESLVVCQLFRCLTFSGLSPNRTPGVSYVYLQPVVEGRGGKATGDV